MEGAGKEEAIRDKNERWVMTGMLKAGEGVRELEVQFSFWSSKAVS